jgi:hypothetical protein
MGEQGEYTIDIFGGGGKSVKAKRNATVATVLNELEAQGCHGYKLISEGKYRHPSEKISALADVGMTIFPPLTFTPKVVPQQYMLQSLHIQNYKSLEDRTFHFKEGFTVIFGDNLCGKTSLVEAIALFGLAINVGWDQDLSKPVVQVMDIDNDKVRDLNIQFNGNYWYCCTVLVFIFAA